MAYMDFMDAFEKKIEEEGTDFLTGLLNSLCPMRLWTTAVRQKR